MGIYSEIGLDQINTILEFYHLAKAKSFHATITGISNSNFKVILVDNSEILLKISNDKTPKQLSNEQEILKTLQKYKFNYALAPFETIDGNSIYHLDEYYGVVFPFIDGKPPVIDNNSIKQLGYALASLHSLKLETNDLLSIRSHENVGYGGISVADYCKLDDCAQDFKKLFLEIFPERLKNIPMEQFPAGIIHGDLYFDNSLFKDGKLITLIDFEQSGRGRFILDIGIAISGSCLNKNMDNIDSELMQQFLAGYESKRPLTVIEQEHLVNAIIVGFFSIGLWRIKRFFLGTLDNQKKFSYRELLTRAQNFWNSKKK